MHTFRRGHKCFYLRWQYDLWRFLPGLGVLMVTISGIVSWYYNTVIAWVIYYLVHAFFPRIPWATCDNWWNTDTCIVSRSDLINQSTVVNSTFNQSDVVNYGFENNSTYKIEFRNITIQQGRDGVFSTAAYEFWEWVNNCSTLVVVLQCWLKMLYTEQQKKRPAYIFLFYLKLKYQKINFWFNMNTTMCNN